MSLNRKKGNLRTNIVMYRMDWMKLKTQMTFVFKVIFNFNLEKKSKIVNK